MAYNGVVNEDNVYSCVGHPLKSDIRDIVTWMLNEPFSVAYNNIMNVKTLKGKGPSKNEFSPKREGTVTKMSRCVRENFKHVVTLIRNLGYTLVWVQLELQHLKHPHFLSADSDQAPRFL